MRKVLKQFLPLIVLLVVLASIMQVFATTEKSAGDKLSVWDRILIAIGLREKPTVEEAREFEYIPGRLQERQFTLPSGGPTLFPPTFGEPVTPPTPRPPVPPIPPLAPRALGVKTTSDALKTTNTVNGFFGGILRSIIADLGLAKPPQPPIPPVLPASTRPSSLGGPKTLGVQDQRPPIPPLPPIPASTQRGGPPIPPRAPR